MCDSKNAKIDWTGPLKFHNNDQFVVEVIGQSLNRGTVVKMYHPKTPDIVYYTIFNTDTGRCMEEGRSNGEYDRITNREEYVWCVSYRYMNSCYVAKHAAESAAFNNRNCMLANDLFCDVSPIWKQIKK